MIRGRILAFFFSVTPTQAYAYIIIIHSSLSQSGLPRQKRKDINFLALLFAMIRIENTELFVSMMLEKCLIMHYIKGGVFVICTFIHRSS